MSWFACSSKEDLNNKAGRKNKGNLIGIRMSLDHLRNYNYWDIFSFNIGNSLQLQVAEGSEGNRESQIADQRDCGFPEFVIILILHEVGVLHKEENEVRLGNLV